MDTGGEVVWIRESLDKGEGANQTKGEDVFVCSDEALLHTLSHPGFGGDQYEILLVHRKLENYYPKLYESHNTQN